MNHDPELPWGTHLRLDRDAYVDDATGERWPSLRAALWNGRLGMPSHNDLPPDDLLELLHAVLATAVRRVPRPHEQAADLFDGSHMFHHSFHLWLLTTGLMTLDEGGHQAIDVTDEGRSVLLMLIATRPYDVRRGRPSAATVAQLAGLAPWSAPFEDRMRRLETEALRWDAAFLRREEMKSPAVVLARRSDDALRTMRTVWTLRFDHVDQRDRFYAWLCVRLDLWQEWGELASEYGSAKLTHRLLTVMTAAMFDGGGHNADHNPGSLPAS